MLGKEKGEGISYFFFFFQFGERWGIGNGEAWWLWAKRGSRQTRKKRNLLWNNTFFEASGLGLKNTVCSDFYCVNGSSTHNLKLWLGGPSQSWGKRPWFFVRGPLVPPHCRWTLWTQRSVNFLALWEQMLARVKSLGMFLVLPGDFTQEGIILTLFRL